VRKIVTGWKNLLTLLLASFALVDGKWDTPKIGVESTERVKRGALRQLKLLDLERP